MLSRKTGRALLGPARCSRPRSRRGSTGFAAFLAHKSELHRAFFLKTGGISVSARSRRGTGRDSALTYQDSDTEIARRGLLLRASKSQSGRRTQCRSAGGIGRSRNTDASTAWRHSANENCGAAKRSRVAGEWRNEDDCPGPTRTHCRFAVSSAYRAITARPLKAGKDEDFGGGMKSGLTGKAAMG